MADLKNKQEEEDEIIIIEKKPPEIEEDEDEDEDDDLSSNHDDEDGDDEDDERRTTGSSSEEEDREAIRERRRKEKLTRKTRRDRAMSRDKLELSFLRNRNDELEKRITGVESKTSQSEMVGIDREIQSTRGQIEAANKVIAKAVEAKNGDDVVKAMNFRDRASTRLSQLEYSKAQRTNQLQAPTAPDPRIVKHAAQFIKDHKWYNPEGKGEESGIVLAIDNSLVNEGYDPSSDDYWSELRTRVKKRLPSHFKKMAKRDDHDDVDDDHDDVDEVRKPRGGPATGSGRQGSGRGGRREVYISPERKQALVEAGVWDDAVLRQKYVKKYMEYDRVNKK